MGIESTGVVLELRDPDGAVLYTVALPAGVTVHQVPLYDSANVARLPGLYRLVATASDAASATLSLRLR